jgi:hypothetical protein
LEDGFCINQGKSTTPSLCSFTTTFSNDVYVGFFATENTNLVVPGDLTGLVVNQYAPGSYFGVAAAAKSLGSAGALPADVGSMNNGGWETIAFALKPLNSGPTPTATATSSTPTATATVVATITPPPSTATATQVATATATQTVTATPAPTAITFIGSTGTTTTRETVPGGVQNGDLLLAFYSYWSSSSATAPSGWNLLHSAASSTSGVETVWYRYANNDVPGTAYTWSFTGTPYAAGGMVAFRGVDPASPEDGFCTNQGKSTTPSLCSFTTAFSNDMYVGFFATENTNLVPPGDLTGLVIRQYLPGSYFGAAAASKSLGSAGALPADIGSMNNGGWETVAVALKAQNLSSRTLSAQPVTRTTAQPRKSGRAKSHATSKHAE